VIVSGLLRPFHLRRKKTRLEEVLGGREKPRPEKKIVGKWMVLTKTRVVWIPGMEEKVGSQQT